MRAISVGLGVFSAGVLTTQAAVFDITPGGALLFDGSQYKVFQAQSISWADAQSYVNANLPGWHLATSTSAIENAFIWGGINGAWAAQGYLPPPGQYWLGGYQDPPATWNWVTGESWSYTNWGPGEPNGDLGWTGHLTIGRFGDWSWNDEGSGPDLITGFVAEVPEPGDWGLLAVLGLVGFAAYRRLHS